MRTTFIFSPRHDEKKASEALLGIFYIVRPGGLPLN
jgi:hypothetical protein